MRKALLAIALVAATLCPAQVTPDPDSPGKIVPKATWPDATTLVLGRTGLKPNTPLEFWTIDDPTKGRFYAFALNISVSPSAVGKTQILVEQQSPEGKWYEFIDHPVFESNTPIFMESATVYRKAYRVTFVDKAKAPVGAAFLAGGIVTFREVPQPKPLLVTSSVKFGQTFTASQGSTWQLLDKHKKVVAVLHVDSILNDGKVASGVTFTLECPLGATKTVTGYLDQDVVAEHYTYEFFTPAQRVFLNFDAQKDSKDTLKCVFDSDMFPE